MVSSGTYWSSIKRLKCLWDKELGIAAVGARAACLIPVDTVCSSVMEGRGGDSLTAGQNWTWGSQINGSCSRHEPITGDYY